MAVYGPDNYLTLPNWKRNCVRYHILNNYRVGGKKVGWFMVFNTTFNNISVISWLSVLLVKKTGVPGENY
jgi:hypothetical protein